MTLIKAMNYARGRDVLMYSKSILSTVLIAFLLVFSTGCTSKVDEVCDEIPDLYGFISDGTQVELIRFGYMWRKGNFSNSEGLTVIADTMAPYQYEHYKTEHTITVTDQTQITLSTSRETVEKGYIKALRYTIWKPDGSVYDDGNREVYSSLSLRMSTDGDGNVILTAPFERGEYFFSVQLEFERGTVEYAFKVIVSFVTVPEAQEIVHEYYREATDVRYTGQKDINYVNLLLPVDAFTFEVDVNGETLICAVSYEDGILFINSDDMWQKLVDAKLRRNVSVSSMVELVEAIASDTHITLSEGVYDVSSISDFNDGYHGRNERTLNISGISNLTLQAAPGAVVEIVTPDRFSEVLAIYYCDNITLNNIRFGHSVTNEYECDAGVISIKNSNNITIDGCYIFGSGSIGIWMTECYAVSVKNTTITDCSLYGVDLWKCRDISFTNCKLTDHRAYMNVIHGYETSAIFTDCEISGNKRVQCGVVDIDGDILFDRCVCRDNAPGVDEEYMNLINGRGISIRGCVIERGSFSDFWTEINDLGGNELIIPDGETNIKTIPAITSVRLLDCEQNFLPVTDGWVNLQALSIISVNFDCDATHVEFYTVPTGTETFLEQRIIGIKYVEKGERTARFEWEVPDGFLGYIWVVVYKGDIARTSNTNEFFIKAIYERQALK